jgi:DNA-binding transcriptional regulator YdaS (Cro superfamily)
MDFKDYYEKLSSGEKELLSKKLGCTKKYLSHLATGYRKAGAKFLLSIESATNGAITPHQLRPM